LQFVLTLGAMMKTFWARLVIQSSIKNNQHKPTSDGNLTSYAFAKSYRAYLISVKHLFTDALYIITGIFSAAFGLKGFLIESDEKEIRKEIDNWIKSKKKLGGLMLDQTKISGIGVAWGSEILYKANLRPDMRTCDQNLSTLSDSILYIRQKIKNIYEKELKANNDSSKDFVNEWFSNLYEIREMEIYKKGSGLLVLGRTWWV
jgi:ribosomal protein S13